MECEHMNLVNRSTTFLSIGLLAAAVFLTVANGRNAWVTPDQMGKRLSSQGRWSEASKVLEDPFSKGVAQFRDGDFKTSAATFASMPGADALFNQANCRVMLGEYERAVELYEQVLQIEGDSTAARQNLLIAKGRAERVRDKGGQMTGGKLGADEIAFDDTSSSSSSSDDSEIVEGESLGDEALRGLWLREVQTTPSDFLRAKFGFQLSRQPPKTSAGSNSEGSP